MMHSRGELVYMHLFILSPSDVKSVVLWSFMNNKYRNLNRSSRRMDRWTGISSLKDAPKTACKERIPRLGLPESERKELESRFRKTFAVNRIQLLLP